MTDIAREELRILLQDVKDKIIPVPQGILLIKAKIHSEYMKLFTLNLSLQDLHAQALATTIWLDEEFAKFNLCWR